MTAYTVSSGTTSPPTTLGSGDSETVLAGGVAFGTLIDGGYQVVNASGSAVSNTIVSGFVNLYGSSLSAVISSGAFEQVLGGTDSQTTVSSGGLLYTRGWQHHERYRRQWRLRTGPGRSGYRQQHPVRRDIDRLRRDGNRHHGATRRNRRVGRSNRTKWYLHPVRRLWDSHRSRGVGTLHSRRVRRRGDHQHPARRRDGIRQFRQHHERDHRYRWRHRDHRRRLDRLDDRDWRNADRL